MATGDVLVIGKGAREQAFVWKLLQSEHVKQVYIAPGNAGTPVPAKNIPISVEDTAGLCSFAREKDIDLTVVGPELPLKLGIVSLFRHYNLDIFGPTATAAKIETSKHFAKKLMVKEGILTAPFRVFASYREACTYIHQREYPCFIKANGLAAGKGAYLCKYLEDAKVALDDLMVKRLYGEAGDVVIIEDFLDGEEISVHSLCYRLNTATLLTARDAKTLKDGDKGPNTGGMGAYAPVSRFTSTDLFHVEQTIINPVLYALDRRGTPFTGTLYTQLMLTKNGRYVVEFNARFGDPEAQVLMALLKSDLFLLLKSWARNEPMMPLFENKYAICVVLCSKEYPSAINRPVPIWGIEQAKQLSDNGLILHGATKLIGNQLHTDGGRVLSVIVIDDSLAIARRLAYHMCDHIHFEKQYRTDIAIPKM